MSTAVVVHKGRTITLTVDLGMDISGDQITSEVRSEPELDAPLLMTWNVAYPSGGDGSDGKLVFTVDDTITAQIPASTGFMDIKRVTGGEPVPVFDRALEVEFRGSVTA